MPSLRRLSFLCAASLLVPVVPLIARSRKPHSVQFKKTILDSKFRSEGASVGDVNRDGKPDVLAGDLWYEAPSWTPHEIRPPQTLDPATQYSDCFQSFGMDVDGDGWVDQVVVGFPGAKAAWLKNPGRGGGEWKETAFSPDTGNESIALMDVDGDKAADLVFGSGGEMTWWKHEKASPTGFVRYAVSEKDAPGTHQFDHGIGVGDVDGDGKADILTIHGYWLAPKDPATGPWRFVAADLGSDCAHMYAYDFNGDGKPDVISSSAHAFGVWWYEQIGDALHPKFVSHTIDDTISETHALMMSDLNGDGQPEFITGKRWWAHGPTGDVNPNDPAVLVWYEFHRTKGGAVTWQKHTIDADSGVGTQFTVADVNGDKKPDIVVSNKKGVFVFEQL